MAAVVLAAGVLALGARADGPEMSWVPVGATGGNVIGYLGSGVNCPNEPTTIKLAAGYDYVVEFELRVAGWSAATGAPTLGTYQAGVDSTGFGDATPYLGPHGGLDGCFIGVELCHFYDVGLLDYVPCDREYCNVWATDDPSCPGEDATCTFCEDNPYFVFAGILGTKAVTTMDPNYAWGATTLQGECKTDPGCPSMYMGTLVLDVPSTARETVTIGFDPGSATTFLNNCSGSPIRDVTLTSGQIDLLTGRCCTYEWLYPVCFDGTTEAECDSWDWVVGETCEHCLCTTCLDDHDCGDGDACTDDICFYEHAECGAVCMRITNYDTMTECCDPIVGQITIMDDGDPCTRDICDDDTGEVSHEPECDDHYRCTHDICTFDGSVECDNSLIYTPGVECCDPGSGELAVIDDGDPCTLDVCSAVTGEVSHEPECVDDDPCTRNVCIFSGTVECDYPPSYNPELHCCVYDSGAVEFIDDGDPCTADACDPATGQVIHDPVDVGTPCDDGLPCTANDACNGAGNCTGLDVGMIPCTGDGDCPAGTCDTDAGRCACLNPPLPAPPPHDQRKNRYISLSPTPFATESVALQVELTASAYFPASPGVLGWVGAPDENGVARVVTDPVYREWGESVINTGDCEIVPVATYAVRAIREGSPEGDPASYSTPLLIETIARPGANHWADGVGILELLCSVMLTPCGDSSECPPGEVCGVWAPPDGFINFNDVTAAVFAFQRRPGLVWPDTSRVDLHGDEFGDAFRDPPNNIVNFSDIQQMVLAFQANPYPYSDPADCP